MSDASLPKSPTAISISVQLVAQFIDSGPLGDDPPTPLLTIQTVDDDDNEASQGQIHA